MHMRFLAVFALAAGLCAWTGDVRAHGSAETDRAALVAVHRTTGGDGWTNNDNWLSDAPLGDWYGVETNEPELLFMAGMRRSEVSALRWSDVVDATDGDGVLVRVRTSKTNQEGDVNDVRFVKDGVARALRTLRACRREPNGAGLSYARSDLSERILTHADPKTRTNSNARVGPVAGERLASQPTLSRFENAVGRNALYRMGCELARRVIERHRRLHGKGAAHHDRSGPDRRPDARRLRLVAERLVLVNRTNARVFGLAVAPR